MHQGYFSLLERLPLPSFYKWEYAGNKHPEPGPLCSKVTKVSLKCSPYRFQSLRKFSSFCSTLKYRAHSELTTTICLQKPENIRKGKRSSTFALLSGGSTKLRIYLTIYSQWAGTVVSAMVSIIQQLKPNCLVQDHSWLTHASNKQAPEESFHSQEREVCWESTWDSVLTKQWQQI